MVSALLLTGLRRYKVANSGGANVRAGLSPMGASSAGVVGPLLPTLSTELWLLALSFCRRSWPTLVDDSVALRPRGAVTLEGVARGCIVQSADSGLREGEGERRARSDGETDWDLPG
jgi:hypothetical protein